MEGRINGGPSITIDFSHFQWYQIQGFPFFDTGYDSASEILLFAFGEELNVTDLREIFARQMESAFFPISLDEMGANFTFDLRKINQETFKGGKLLISPHLHPGGAHGYRLEVYGKSIVFCTDIEHGFKIDPKVVELARDADLLIHEAQFTPEELPNFRGWGHSSWEQAHRHQRCLRCSFC
jgi:phosphoribosyl 1,2-cyclic phosphodiesterase